MPLDADPQHRHRDRLEVRKAVEAVAIKPLTGRLTLLTRKLYNVLLCHAQTQGRAVSRYRIPLSELIRDAHFDSRDTDLIKEHLQAMQTTLVEWSNPREWASSQLLGEVRIFKDTADGNLLWLEWQYLPSLKEKLVEPARYARLALRYQGMLRSGSALALYEIAVRYATNPSHLTNRLPWQDWVQMLSGNPERQVTDYKYAKRDVFRPAIAEVNAMTDVRVELIEHKRGRRVIDLQFRVERTTPILEADAQKAGRRLDLSLIERMVRLGLANDDAEHAFCTHGEQVVRDSLEYVEARIKRSPPVESKAALFRWALRHPEVHAGGRTPQQQTERKARMQAVEKAEASSRLAALRAAFLAREVDRLRELFAEYPQAERDAVLRDFEQSELGQQPKAIQRSFRERRLEDRLASTAFFEWLLKREGGVDASDGALLQFAAETRQLVAGGV